MSCPICKKPTNAAYRPFCSTRCADVDLGRWFNESYVIPQPLTEADLDEIDTDLPDTPTPPQDGG